MSGEAKSGYAGYASASSDYSRTVAFREAQGWYERSVSEAQTLYEEAAQYDEGARLQEMLNAHETQIDPSVRPRQTRRRPASTGENKDGAAAGDESDAEFLEPGHRNMAALLLAAPVMAVPDRRAFIVERADGTNDAMTFRELWNGAKAVCEGLRRAGLRKGDRAIVMVPMSPELYVVLIALFKLGATAVFIDPWMGIKKVAHFAGIADPRAFIGPQKAHALRKLNKGVDAIPIQVLVELGGTGATFTGCAGCIAALCCVGRGALSFRGMLRDFEGDDTICDVAADDVALITFTTGSSGQPKGITRTHGILTSQQEYLRSASYLHNDVDLATFPMFALNNMAWGIPSIIPPINLKKVAETDGAAVLKLMRKHGISTTTSSPPFYDRLADFHEAHPEVPAHNLRRILVGGAPVSQAQLRRWGKVWPNTFIVVGYGSSECEPVAHIAAMERLWNKSKLRPEAPGICLGKIVPGVEARVIGIVDGIVAETNDCEILNAGEIGELIIGGPHVVQEYYNNPEAIRKNKIKDSETGMQWHRMGDTGYLDSDGYFWITGRCHSTIYLGEGKGVLHPQIVEQIVAGDGVLTEQAGMVHVAAVGIGADKKKQQCYVVVQTKEAPDEDVWAKNLVPDMAERLSKRDIDVAGLVVWNRPMPLDPRHNSKIVYKQLAVNMAGAVEAIQSYDYAGSGAAQTMEMGQHRAVLFDRLSTQRSVGEVETKASDVEPKVDTAPLL